MPDRKKLFPFLLFLIPAGIFSVLLFGWIPKESPYAGQKSAGVSVIDRMAPDGKSLGIFLGINGDESSRLEPYSIVVIEPSEFSREQIEALHQRGKLVFGYLNLGSLESYRPYAARFHHLTLGAYENWPQEQWVDVSREEWQDFVVKELAFFLLDKGVDGFFIDNTDIYYLYPREDIYRGIVSILQQLKETECLVILNGGDAFVRRSLQEGTAGSLFDGVNQETVFTSIDFSSETYGKQDPEITAYFLEYLTEVQKAGRWVWLLEYGADAAAEKTIAEYCTERGFFWYNAESLYLR